MQQQRNTIQDWALDDRPREKMMTTGAEALSNAELMAILIGSGQPGLSAVDLMRQVLARYGNSLKQLSRATVEDLMQIKGIGPAKALTILAACQVGQRRLNEEVREKNVITDSQDISNYFSYLCNQPHEEFHLLLMKQDLSIIDSVRLSKGGYTETVVDLRQLFEEALRKHATVLALCHNHPSGNLHPSRPDDNITKRVSEACQIMGLRLLDHVIVSDCGYYSYADEGRLG